eukprot:1526616-Pleurochrysis_carterae.AAC.3
MDLPLRTDNKGNVVGIRLKCVLVLGNASHRLTRTESGGDDWEINTLTATRTCSAAAPRSRLRSPCQQRCCSSIASSGDAGQSHIH